MYSVYTKGNTAVTVTSKVFNEPANLTFVQKARALKPTS